MARPPGGPPTERPNLPDFTPEERQAFYDAAAHAAAFATGQIRCYANRDACWAASDLDHRGLSRLEAMALA